MPPSLLDELPEVAAEDQALDEAAERAERRVEPDPVANRLLGRLFGYHGSFTVNERPCTPDDIPGDVLPVREEPRE